MRPLLSPPSYMSVPTLFFWQRVGTLILFLQECSFWRRSGVGMHIFPFLGVLDNDFYSSNMIRYTCIHVHMNTYMYTHTSYHSHTISSHTISLQHTATHCNTLQHTATHCNTICTHTRVIIHIQSAQSRLKGNYRRFACWPSTMYTHIHTCIYTCTYIHACINTYICIYTHIYTRTHVSYQHSHTIGAVKRRLWGAVRAD